MSTRSRHSAGLLLFRRTRKGLTPEGRTPEGQNPEDRTPEDGTPEDRTPEGLEVLLGHMGGPFFARRDAGAWTVPKGEYDPTEPAWDAARREFREELGLEPPDGPAVPLGEVRQAGGKVVTVWAVEAGLDPAAVVPGTFSMEWPPRSGRVQEFPELDWVAWFALDRARTVIVKAQTAFLDRLAEHSASGTP